MFFPLSWNDCRIQRGLTKLLSWKKCQDYIHKAEWKTATFYSLIKDVGVLGLISSSAWGNLNQHHLSPRRIPQGCAVLHTKVDCSYSPPLMCPGLCRKSFQTPSWDLHVDMVHLASPVCANEYCTIKEYESTVDRVPLLGYPYCHGCVTLLGKKGRHSSRRGHYTSYTSTTSGRPVC